ncbi:MAG: phospholipase D-like domain-containing protein [Candidatus Methylumidiphilus sp.]
MADPKDYSRECKANPTISAPNVTNQWFIDPPTPNKFKQRGGNAVTLLNCGEEYLPQLKAALSRAKKSIYIAVWGFDDRLSMDLLGADDIPNEKSFISTLLKERADAGVEVKILVWHQMVVNTFGGEPSINQNTFSKSWTQKAMAGEFPNIQFVTRNPGGFENTPKGKAKIQELDNEINQIYKHSFMELSPADQERVNDLKQRKSLIKSGGVNTEEMQQKRKERAKKEGEGWIANMGLVATHHQKMVLIDYQDAECANGFVQGFNMLPIYFDRTDHPYRELCHEPGCIQHGGVHTHRQDVGLHLRGSCLVDLFHNFKESWEQALSAYSNSLKLKNGYAPFKANALPPPTYPINSTRTHSAQILRTWPLNDENQIQQFIEKAIPRLNEFIYIEDQYFRMPEFAELLTQRGKKIASCSLGQKKLHVFVVTSLNDAKNAIGDSALRHNMVKLLGRQDVNAEDKQAFNKAQTDANELAQRVKEMDKRGVRVHVCQLLSCKPCKVKASRGRGVSMVDGAVYHNIFVHSKISFYDDAFVLLGSANWNLRSMTQDSELNIAIECHDGGNDDGLGRRFRQKLWSQHLHGSWLANDKVGKPTEPADWYAQWDDLLKDNWTQFMNNKVLTMNLFPYFENIAKLNKKFMSPLNNFKQNSG